MRSCALSKSRLRKAATVRQVSSGCAVVGPPNSGKSTLFNRLTGLRQKVANYPGVTVEKRIGRLAFAGAPDAMLIDLPGVYSLEPRSEDERVTRDVLTGVMRFVRHRASPFAVMAGKVFGLWAAISAAVLAAYVVTAGPEGQDTQLLRTELRRRLPDHMVPSGFVAKKSSSSARLEIL